MSQPYLLEHVQVVRRGDRRQRRIDCGLHLLRLQRRDLNWVVRGVRSRHAVSGLLSNLATWGRIGAMFRAGRARSLVTETRAARRAHGHRAVGSVTGKTTTNRAPPSGGGTSAIRPPWPSTIPLTTYSPKPVPPRSEPFQN